MDCTVNSVYLTNPKLVNDQQVDYMTFKILLGEMYGYETGLQSMTISIFSRLSLNGENVDQCPRKKESGVNMF